jgi:hypothetical protein
MATKITREVIEAQLNCKYKSRLLLSGQHGVSTEYELLRREARTRIALIGSANLAALAKNGEVPRDVVLTRELLKGGAPLILRAAVEDERFSIIIDGLQKVAGASDLGSFHYVPVLFHEAERANRTAYASNLR